MVSLSFSLFLCVLYSYYLGLIKSRGMVVNVLLAISISVSHILEVAILSPLNWFPLHDEMTFLGWASAPLGNILNEHSRYLLYVLYSHITIESGGEILLKFHSLPFGLIVLMALYEGSGRNSYVIKLFPVIFGYIYLLASLNMRDAILMSLVVFLLAKMSKSQWARRTVWLSAGVVLLLFLRPEWAGLMVLVHIWYLFYRMVGYSILVGLVFPAVAVFSFFSVEAVFDFTRAMIGIVDPGRLDVYLSSRDEVVSQGGLMVNNALSVARQLFTPIPTSKIYQIVVDGLQSPSFLIDYLRIIMMFSVYVMVIFSAWKYKFVRKLVREDAFVSMILMFSAINTILYAVYNDGGGASRTKVYPYFFLFVVFCKWLKARKNGGWG